MDAQHHEEPQPTTPVRQRVRSPSPPPHKRHRSPSPRRHHQQRPLWAPPEALRRLLGTSLGLLLAAALAAGTLQLCAIAVRAAGALAALARAHRDGAAVAVAVLGAAACALGSGGSSSSGSWSNRPRTKRVSAAKAAQSRCGGGKPLGLQTVLTLIVGACLVVAGGAAVVVLGVHYYNHQPYAPHHGSISSDKIDSSEQPSAWVERAARLLAFCDVGPADSHPPPPAQPVAFVAEAAAAAAYWRLPGVTRHRIVFESSGRQQASTVLAPATKAAVVRATRVAAHIACQLLLPAEARIAALPFAVPEARPMARPAAALAALLLATRMWCAAVAAFTFSIVSLGVAGARALAGARRPPVSPRYARARNTNPVRLLALPPPQPPLPAPQPPPSLHSKLSERCRWTKPPGQDCRRARLPSRFAADRCRSIPSPPPPPAARAKTVIGVASAVPLAVARLLIVWPAQAAVGCALAPPRLAWRAAALAAGAALWAARASVRVLRWCVAAALPAPISWLFW